jgi:hypothetical protein
MEARTAFRGSAISRNMVAFGATLLAAIALIAMGGLLIKTVSVPAAAPAKHIVAGQPGGSGFGSAWNYTMQRSGTQTVEGPVPAGLSTGASFREPGTRRGGPQS